MFRIQSKRIEGLMPIGVKSPEILKNKKVIVRCDFNVPVSEKGKILNSRRIESCMKTLCYLKNSGSKIILISHIGRRPEETLKPVFDYLKKKFEITFEKEISFPDTKKKVDKLQSGEFILLENIRRFKEEENNDESFAKLLSTLGDFYVNEAFSVSHRNHASVTRLPKFLPSFIGFHVQEEINNLSKMFEPKHPFSILIGGAKFQTKIKLVESLKDKADFIFIGGALSNDLYKAKGYEIGQSMTSDISIDDVNNILSFENVFVPPDVLVIDKNGKKKNKKPNEVNKDEKIVDGGSKTYKFLKEKIKDSEMIVWNGPFGFYEEGFDKLTKKVAKLIAKKDAHTIVGGGDTLVEIKKLRNSHKFDFVSIGGGAMLDFISKGTLPGIEALKNKK